MAGEPFQVAGIHKSLGTDVSAQRRRRTRLQQHRLAAAARRRKRLQRLRKASAKIGHVLRAGPAAVALWAIASLRGCCPGERKAGTAAACSRISRGVRPQHAQAIRG
eukprot:5565131-Amphidinium_carterae.1